MRHEACELEIDHEELRAERREEKEWQKRRERAATEKAGPVAVAAAAKAARVALLDADELVDLFEQQARLAVQVCSWGQCGLLVGWLLEGPPQ